MALTLTRLTDWNWTGRIVFGNIQWCGEKTSSITYGVTNNGPTNFSPFKNLILLFDPKLFLNKKNLDSAKTQFSDKNLGNSIFVNFKWRQIFSFSFSYKFSNLLKKLSKMLNFRHFIFECIYGIRFRNARFWKTLLNDQKMAERFEIKSYVLNGISSFSFLLSFWAHRLKFLWKNRWQLNRLNCR